jgi:hypothetical protein
METKQVPNSTDKKQKTPVWSPETDEPETETEQTQTEGCSNGRRIESSRHRNSIGKNSRTQVTIPKGSLGDKFSDDDPLEESSESLTRPTGWRDSKTEDFSINL